MSEPLTEEYLANLESGSCLHCSDCGHVADLLAEVRRFGDPVKATAQAMANYIDKRLGARVYAEVMLPIVLEDLSRLRAEADDLLLVLKRAAELLDCQEYPESCEERGQCTACRVYVDVKAAIAKAEKT